MREDGKLLRKGTAAAMMKIGEFAKLARVSIKTLRFYDVNGLVKPAYKDDQTGYRYYTEEQLLTVKRIKALKEQGLSLEMIKQLMQASAAAEAKTLLHQHKQSLEEQLASLKQHLHAVSDQLERIEELQAYETPVKRIRSVPPIKVAMIRRMIRRSQLCLLLDELIQAVETEDTRDENTRQILMIIWYDEEEKADGLCDVAVAIPLTQTIPDNEHVRIEEAFVRNGPQLRIG